MALCKSTIFRAFQEVVEMAQTIILGDNTLQFDIKGKQSLLGNQQIHMYCENYMIKNKCHYARRRCL